MKEERLRAFFSMMDLEQYALVVGRDTEDPLRYAFHKKRVVHAGLKGQMIDSSHWSANWNLRMSQKGTRRKRTAYVHIPFCQSKCLYCGFFQNFSNEEVEDAYIDRLITELQISHATRYCSSDPVHAVFIGGGTPSVLSAANIRRLLQALTQYLPLANDCEITFEARVHDLVPEKMEACLENGVNRISIGVQSFHTDIRRKVGRLNTLETVMERLRLLSDYDQAAVVIDLMYGLPLQSMEIWLEDVALLKEAAIDGADLYQLNVYPTSLLRRAIEDGNLPAAATTAEQAIMFANAEMLLTESRFRRLSICHWAKTGRERNLYNTLSKGGAAVLPFGAGAGGNIDGLRVSVDRDLHRYMRGIDHGEKPLAKMLRPHPLHDLLTEVVGQMEQGYLNMFTLAARYGEEVLELEPLLRIWEDRGLITRGAGMIHLTIAGQFWHVNVMQSVLECLKYLFLGQCEQDQPVYQRA